MSEEADWLLSSAKMITEPDNTKPPENDTFVVSRHCYLELIFLEILVSEPSDGKVASFRENLFVINC